MNEDQRLRHLTWVEVEQYVREIVRQLGPTPKIKHILAVARGGMVPAVMLAHHLNVPVESVTVKTYHGKKAGTPVIYDAPEIKDVDDWLIVDDIADTGATINALRDLYPGIRVAALVQKETQMAADYFGADVKLSEWVVFPWEQK